LPRCILCGLLSRNGCRHTVQVGQRLLQLLACLLRLLLRVVDQRDRRAVGQASGGGCRVLRRAALGKPGAAEGARLRMGASRQQRQCRRLHQRLDPPGAD
jgi:hypothetical protein